MSTAGRDRLVLALDVEWPSEALELARRLAPWVGTFKVGPAHVLAEGSRFVDAIKGLGRKVFLDMKLYDIPETVRRVCRQAAGLGVDFLTVHISGGSRMLSAALQGAKEASANGAGVTLLGVTVLTSFDQSQLEREWKLQESVEERVLFWAELARTSGLNGIVCSPLELQAIRSRLDADLLTVVPGIRSAQEHQGDQSRTLTAGEAIVRGADLIVVGRPILTHADPAVAARSFVEEIEGALKVKP